MAMTRGVLRVACLFRQGSPPLPKGFLPLVLGVCLLAEPSLAQHNLQRTLTIDVDFATVEPGTVNAGDSFAFSALASQ